jgi:ADP-ribosylglycohydrolase
MRPYNSFGNGSAMRVSPVGFAFNTLEEVLSEAQHSAEATHNHPEGIKGAQATAAAIFLARQGKKQTEIGEYIEKTFQYDVSTPVEQIRPMYSFDETCQRTVPQAIRCFLEAKSFEEAIRLAVSLGGDSDTLACITGGIAQAYFGVPKEIEEKVFEILDPQLAEVVREFSKKFQI